MMSRSDPSITRFLLEFCVSPTFAVTVTSVDESLVYRTKVTRERLEKSCCRVIKRINAKCFSRGQRRKKHSIGDVTAIEGFDGRKKLHAHLAMSSPPQMSNDEFKLLVESEFSKDYWIDKQIKIDPYRDTGWIEYITKLGPEAIAPYCLFRAFPLG
jgi:hypothetical protein